MYIENYYLYKIVDDGKEATIRKIKIDFDISNFMSYSKTIQEPYKDIKKTIEVLKNKFCPLLQTEFKKCFIFGEYPYLEIVLVKNKYVSYRLTTQELNEHQKLLDAYSITFTQLLAIYRMYGKKFEWNDRKLTLKNDLRYEIKR